MMVQPDPRPAGSTRAVERALRTVRLNPFRTGVILGTVVTIAVVLLIVQNGESAQLDWLMFHFKAPLWIILFLTAVAGAIVWELTKVAVRRGRNRRTLPPPEAFIDPD